MKQAAINRTATPNIDPTVAPAIPPAFLWGDAALLRDGVDVEGGKMERLLANELVKGIDEVDLVESSIACQMLVLDPILRLLSIHTGRVVDQS